MDPGFNYGILPHQALKGSDMKMKNFTRYEFIDGVPFDTQNNKMMEKVNSKGRHFYNLYDDSNIRKQVSSIKISREFSLGIEIPKEAVPIKGYEDYFICRDGRVFSAGKKSSSDRLLKHVVSGKGYPSVGLYKEGRPKKVDIHVLLIKTFVMHDYIEKGLCCLHADDNKMNYSLDNLSVGTYSQNNKDAYTRGLNNGNRRLQQPL